ncbi:hypothetical protein MB9_1463 [Methanobacterium formicicum]|jgi:hypothetical protein|uniref:Uncharacterized protein n=1 Tax=Methanobacterium formicicum TaxID=2162 RepID=A0A0S4FPU3_METFO|nr:hypothetical protein MB9_1463 [Methanobacterium formicicum]
MKGEMKLLTLDRNKSNNPDIYETDIIKENTL